MPVRGPTDGIRGFIEEFDAAMDVGGFWMPVLRPFLTGRLARWAAIARWLEKVLEKDDVWFAPLEEIARHASLHRDLLRIDTVAGEET